MKITKPTILVLSFLFSYLTLVSQSFLNGDFEKNDPGCHLNVSNTTFNFLVEDCFGFGTAQQLDVIAYGCDFGEAHGGVHFLGLAVFFFDNQSDAFSLKLDKSLTANQEYELSFYKRLAVGWFGNQIEVGYSNDSLEFGILIDTISGASSVENWDHVILNFEPEIEAKFITVRSVLDIDGGNFLDDFSIRPIRPNFLNEKQIQVEINLFPNPTASILNVQSRITIHKASIQIRNAVGNLVWNNDYLNFKEEAIKVSDFPPGFYFISISGDKVIGTAKFLKI